MEEQNSRAITKTTKPKIRIIHVFPPEIIKTDTANFRDLVQRLTGKHANETGEGSRQKKRRKVHQPVPTMRMTGKLEFPVSNDIDDDNKADGRPYESHDSGFGGWIKKEEEEEDGVWVENSSGFFGGLADLDGFIQGLIQYPPVTTSTSAIHTDMFGDTPIPS